LHCTCRKVHGHEVSLQPLLVIRARCPRGVAGQKGPSHRPPSRDDLKRRRIKVGEVSGSRRCSCSLPVDQLRRVRPFSHLNMTCRGGVRNERGDLLHSPLGRCPSDRLVPDAGDIVRRRHDRTKGRVPPSLRCADSRLHLGVDDPSLRADVLRDKNLPSTCWRHGAALGPASRKVDPDMRVCLVG